MGARGSCAICFDPRREAIDAARAGGMPVATLARTFNVPTTTLRRHVAHSRPAIYPKRIDAAAPTPPRYTSGPTRGTVPLARVKEAAALLAVPLHELLVCLSEHLAYDIATPTEAEEEELWGLFDAADDDADYLRDVARHGRFLAG